MAGNAAVLVNPYRVSELAEAMDKALSDQGLRRSLITKGLERAKLFTWEKCARETLKIYLGENGE